MLIQQLANGVILGSTYGLMAIGLTIIFGILNIINLAHGEIYMLGAFVAYFLVTLWGFNFFFRSPAGHHSYGLFGGDRRTVGLPPVAG